MFRDVSQELGAARNQRNSAVQFRQIRENGENEVSAKCPCQRRAVRLTNVRRRLVSLSTRE